MDRYEVVIVDDDDQALGVLQRILTLWGYNVFPFRAFEGARDFVSAHPPDALIVDVRLGSYNGLQLVHLAKHLAPQMSIIVVSGFDDAVLRAEAERAGATFLAKPIDSEELRELLPRAVN